jgi:hypothetical protein
VFAFPRHEMPEPLRHFPPSPNSRGRRESRVRAAPAVSCAKCTKESAHEHTGSAEAIRPSLRNGFTAYFVLSPVTGFLATVTSSGLILRNLAPAPGRQDHTTSPSAIILRSSSQASASTASHRAFVTCATPLSSGETGELVALICPTG